MRKIFILLITILSFVIPIYANSDSVIYLTFDDGPNYIGTDKIIEILDKYDIKATFFIVGDFASYYPEKVKNLYNSGHIIGCHTCTHEYKSIYKSTESIINDIYEWEELISGIIGTELTYKLFRFPGGSRNTVLTNDLREDMLNKIYSDGYRVFDWTITNNDAHVMRGMTADNRKEYVKHALIQNLESAEHNSSDPKIILMHDIKKHTADTLEWTIEYLIDCGYTFDTLDKLNHSFIFK